jgi:hypothetical protein
MGKLLQSGKVKYARPLKETPRNATIRARARLCRVCGKRRRWC